MSALARLWFPKLLLPGLNGKEGLMRSHWTRKRMHREAVAATLLAYNRPLPRIRQPVYVVYTRRHFRQAMDWTNAGASFKHLEDVLVQQGILPDDSPQWVTGITLRQERVPKGQHGSLVILSAADQKETSDRSLEVVEL